MERRRLIIGSTAVVLVVLAALAIVLVTRESPSSTEPTAVQITTPSAVPTTAPTPTPDPTPAEVIWAGEVCTSITALKDVASTIPESALREIDPTKDLAAQAEQQVEKAMVTLQVPLDELGFALGSVPLDYADTADALIKAQGLYETAQAQVTATQDTLNKALSATTPVEGILLFGQALDSGRQAYETGQKLVTVLETFDSDERLRGAFDKAPECRSL